MKRAGKIILNNAIKTFTDDQDKIIPPQQTLDKFKSKLKSADVDILVDTVRVDNGRLGIPVFFSTCGAEAHEVIGTRKQMGKGATVAQAEASAVMELAERYSFFSFYKNPANVIFDTFENLSGNVLSFEQIAKSVHDESDDLEVTEKIFKALPLNWTGAYNLTSGREVIIPLNWFYAINAFNGPSAGNCVEEALCQGICEVVERHVSSLISRNKIPTPTIELESITDSLVLDMLRKYSDSGINLSITDFTNGVGIPSVGVLAYDPKTFPKSSEIVWTAGTAPDPQKALSRALTEVAQLAGDFNTGSNYLASGLPKFRSIDELDFVLDMHSSVNVMDLPDISDNNIKVEVENCVNALNKINMDTIVVDTTHPLLKIPAFYTIVPGSHFRERAVKTSTGMFLAKIISNSFDHVEAITRLKNMDELLPGKYFIWFFIGRSYLNLNKYDEAIACFSKALKLSPDEQDIPSIYSYLGVSFKDLGRYNKAIQTLKKGELLDDGRTDIHNLKGFCYFKLKNYEKAIESFSRVIDLDPGSAIDYANIASNYRDMGEKNKAIKFYKIALEIDPSIDFAIQNLRILSSKG